MEKIGGKIIRVPWTRKERKIFAAFEWNDKVKEMYRDIFAKITNDPNWEKSYGYKWHVQYGAEFIIPEDSNWNSTTTPKDIEEFIHQNKQLYDIFVKGISSCDLFIADITSHNPNVMIELGIAVQQNKNILVVTSQDINDMVFDIRGLKAFKYTSKEKLQKLIEKHIGIYLTIKGQVFERGKFISTKNYALDVKGVLKNKEAQRVGGIPNLRNLRIRVKFRFIFSTNHNLDWFGVSLRTQGPGRYFSELVLVRYSGETRSLTFPEKRKEHDGKRIIDFNPEDSHNLEILIDESRLAVWVDSELVLEDVDVIIESFGEVWISCNDHHEAIYFKDKKDGPKSENEHFFEVEYKNIEILDLNTTANLYDKSGPSS